MEALDGRASAIWEPQNRGQAKAHPSIDLPEFGGGSTEVGRVESME